MIVTSNFNFFFLQKRGFILYLLKHACVDLIGVSPLVGLGVGPFTVGQTALKVASSKVAKYEKACSDNQHAFIPFAFDTFGFLAPEAVDLLLLGP